MSFYSLNNPLIRRTFSDATREGIAPDRGLYFPAHLPRLSFEEWEQGMRVWELGARILHPLIEPCLTLDQLLSLLRQVLDFPFPLRELDEGCAVLELFHGPTAAFKDVGARFMARALSIVNESPLTVLVATSGDTGSAVAQGFVGVEGIDVVILYPSGRVSPLQERQLTTVGANVSALEVQGSFDDCQDMVKTAFLDPDVLKARPLTSANSINVARWLPQSIYFAWTSYQTQEEVLFSVPSGNVGNLAAGALAWKLGVPMAGLIAATNANDGLATFLNGKEFVSRPSKLTLSNAMDVGDPSNLPRLVALFGEDLQKLRANVRGISISDHATQLMMRRVAEEHDYLFCPHSAVGYAGLKALKNNSSLNISLATAHPAKFGQVVEAATGQIPSVPEHLLRCLTLPEEKTLLPADYSALKEYLLS